jgi:hypothetical protein
MVRNLSNISNAAAAAGGGGGGGGAADASQLASNNGFASVDAELDSIRGRTEGFAAGRTVIADAGGILASGSKTEADLVSTSDNNTFTGSNVYQTDLVLNINLQFADDAAGAGNAQCHMLDQDSNLRVAVDSTGVGFFNGAAPQAIACKYQVLDSLVYAQDSQFQITNSNAGTPLQLFSVDGRGLASEIHLRPTGSATSGISVTPTQVILRDNTLISSGKDIFLDGAGVQGGVAFSLNALNSAPVWVNFDTLGPGNTTIFTRSSPVSNNDPTHITSATHPAGANNSNQNANEFDCAASRETRVNANGDLVYRVTLRGRVFKLGGANAGTPLFMLPAGYRPTRTVNYFSRQDTGSSISIMTLLATGVCTMHAGSIATIDVSYWTN